MKNLRSLLHGIAFKYQKICTALFVATGIFFSPSAYALKLTSFTPGIGTEFGSFVQLVLLIIAGCGVMFGGVATISWISCSRRKEPATWQLQGVIGGAAALIIPVALLALSGSLTGEQGNAEQMFQDLGIGY